MITADEIKIVNDDELSLFSRQQEFDKFSYYFDEAQEDKYYHNFFLLKSDIDEETINQIIIDEKEKKHTHVCFKFDEQSMTAYFVERKNIVIDHNIIMVASLNHVDEKITVTNDYRVKIVENETEKEELRRVMYFSDEVSGISYAKKNSLRQISMISHDNFNYFLVYSSLNEAVGFVKTYQLFSTASIDNFYIIEKYRHQGYGTSLMKKVITYLRSKNVSDIFLEADYDDTPKEMYGRWGFTKSSQYFFVIINLLADNEV